MASSREVSLVVAGANPGAFIDFVDMAHGEGGEQEMILSAYEPFPCSAPTRSPLLFIRPALGMARKRTSLRTTEKRRSLRMRRPSRTWWTA